MEVSNWCQTQKLLLLAKQVAVDYSTTAAGKPRAFGMIKINCYQQARCLLIILQNLLPAKQVLVDNFITVIGKPGSLIRSGHPKTAANETTNWMAVDYFN